MASDKYKSSQEFLEKMDAGDLDGNFIAELKTLTRQQLEEVAQLLADRDAKEPHRKRYLAFE